MKMFHEECVDNALSKGKSKDKVARSKTEEH